MCTKCCALLHSSSKEETTRTAELISLRVISSQQHMQCLPGKKDVCPILSLKCSQSPNGSQMFLCSAKNHHESVEHGWIRDGDILYSSDTNTTFTGKPFYSCWVNHSSIYKQCVANVSISKCFEQVGNQTLMMPVLSAVFFVSLIIGVVLRMRYKRAHQSSPIQVNVADPDIYSMLNDHHPVPCSPVGTLAQ
ncbi:hypothetical protein DNTS_020337 [Danionella cerebrum]|uniref:Ig-like domain-containing protein n=1 Tax=Danionella cerebrum TaxID=2873325 RepID=A0A553R4T7_9TELE|nr:hypothetical protein DNTS_020337 [Danionella translucida]